MNNKSQKVNVACHEKGKQMFRTPLVAWRCQFSGGLLENGPFILSSLTTTCLNCAYLLSVKSMFALNDFHHRWHQLQKRD